MLFILVGALYKEKALVEALWKLAKGSLAALVTRYDASSHLRSPVEGKEAEDEDEAAQPGEGHRVARDGLALAVLQYHV